MDLINISLFATALTLFGLSLLIINGEKNISNKVFSLFILSISLWSIGILSFRLTNSTYWGLIYSNFNYFIAAIIATSFLHFSYIFPDHQKNSLKLIFILYVPALLIATGVILNPNLILIDVYHVENNIKLATVHTVNYTIYAIYFIVLVILANINLFLSYIKSKDKIIKTQIRLIIIGTLIPYLFAMYFDLILAAFNYKYVWAGPFMGIIVVYVILYAVYRHHLLNVEAITAEILTFILWVFTAIRTLLSINRQETITDVGLLLLISVIGLFLIRSVRREIKIRKKSEYLASELKNSNIKLTDLNQTLSEKVLAQTLEIRTAYELEKKARRDLEKLNETKDQFIMITQHHLRTPVTSIQWELEAIENGQYGEVAPNIKEALKDTKTATDRLMRIVNDFLSITAIKAGSNILNLKNTNLKPLLEDVLKELKIDIDKMHLTVKYPEDAKKWPDLQLDESKIREVLLIVIENAVKYNTLNGTIQITTDNKEDDSFEMLIENTGVGMTKEDTDKIFNTLFYRGNTAKTANPIGMGVGLSVARAIVRAHHGELSIESEGNGKGARVRMELLTKNT